MGDVADAEGDRIGVEGAIGEGQRLGIALRRCVMRSRERRARRTRPRATSSISGLMSQRTAVAFSPEARGEADGDVAGAAGDIEQPERRAAARRLDHGDEVVLPQPMQAAGHEIVHEVVAAGDGREDAVDEALALAFGHVAEAEARRWRTGVVVWLVAHGREHSQGVRDAPRRRLRHSRMSSGCSAPVGKIAGDGLGEHRRQQEAVAEGAVNEDAPAAVADDGARHVVGEGGAHAGCRSRGSGPRRSPGAARRRRRAARAPSGR